MGRLIYFAVFFTGCMAMSIAMSPEEVVKMFEKNGFVPDMVPVAPEKLVRVTYPSGAVVAEGNEITPTMAKDAPNVDWDIEDGALYTLYMGDFDSPSRDSPYYREWLHWQFGNIPGTDLAGADTLAEFIGIGPSQDTGLHRFVFFVYKQPSRIEFTEERLYNTNALGRAGFNIAKFAEKYNLGNPVAGNFFQASYDDYVPIIHKMFAVADVYPH